MVNIHLFTACFIQEVRRRSLCVCVCVFVCVCVCVYVCVWRGGGVGLRYKFPNTVELRYIKDTFLWVIYHLNDPETNWKVFELPIRWNYQFEVQFYLLFLFVWFILYTCLCFSLRKHAYSNIVKILPQKIEKVQIKNSDTFHISAQKHRLWVLVRTASPRRF